MRRLFSILLTLAVPLALLGAALFLWLPAPALPEPAADLLRRARIKLLPSPLLPPAHAGTDPDPALPTLADFWAGRAEFVVDVAETGLPMGESETVAVRGRLGWPQRLWSYVHASDRSAGVVDQCGAPVEFPGCVVIYRSRDGGRSFALTNPTCQIECTQCPCDSGADHIEQQQYPRVALDADANPPTLHMVYEYRGMVMHRASIDGAEWSPPSFVPGTGYWDEGFEGRACQGSERIGPHPFVTLEYDCLRGGPPGIYIEGGRMFVFVALGQNPGSLGCLVGDARAGVDSLEPCAHNPLFTGSPEYGPTDGWGAQSNAHYTFRTLSSADVHRIGEHYYMLFEGVRGPGPGDAGDTQFGLGLARSTGPALDGPWELFPGNPILIDLPGNIGLGHADLIVLDGRTYLYTSLDGETRSRLALVWR